MICGFRNNGTKIFWHYTQCRDVTVVLWREHGGGVHMQWKREGETGRESEGAQCENQAE